MRLMRSWHPRTAYGHGAAMVTEAQGAARDCAVLRRRRPHDPRCRRAGPDPPPAPDGGEESCCAATSPCASAGCAAARLSPPSSSSSPPLLSPSKERPLSGGDSAPPRDTGVAASASAGIMPSALLARYRLGGARARDASRSVGREVSQGQWE